MRLYRGPRRKRIPQWGSSYAVTHRWKRITRWGSSKAVTNRKEE